MATFDLLPVFAISFFGIFLNVWFFIMTFDSLGASVSSKVKSLRRLPGVSILIPAHNEAGSIARTLSSVAKMDYPRSKLEVIVIDNASTDGTADIAGKFKWAKVFKIKEKGKAVALQIGFRKSRNQIIGILDADTMVSRNVMKKMVGHFADPKIGAVTNLIKVDSKKNLLSIFQHIEYTASGLSKKLLSAIDSLYITPGTLSLVRREAIKKVGFSGDTLTEDMDLALSLIKKNYKIFHCLDASVTTIVPKTLKEWIVQRIRWYRGYTENMKKHRDLIFGRKNLMLGWFIIPISGLVSIAVGIYTTFYLLGDFAFTSALKLKTLSQLPTADQIALIIQSFPPVTSLIYNPYALMLFTTVFITSILVILISARKVGGFTRRDLLFVPIYMLVYYSIIMFFWLISVLHEFSRRDKTW